MLITIIKYDYYLGLAALGENKCSVKRGNRIGVEEEEELKGMTFNGFMKINLEQFCHSCKQEEGEFWSLLQI